MKNGSIFKDLHYNSDLYTKTIKNIEYLLAESRKKSESINAFNFEASELQSRLNKLRMKVGTIEVGGESDLSQGLLYDAVDDTVKATASAYHNGYVYGCSLSTIRAVREVLIDFLSNEKITELDILIAKIIYKGFRSVYKLLLQSRYRSEASIEVANIKELDNTFVKSLISDIHSIFGISLYNDEFIKFLSYYKESITNEMNLYDADMQLKLDFFDLLIDYSIFINKPFDLVNCTFNDLIINSAKTDKEVLKASSDLISLLVTGNQFILADHQ